jgi:alkylresorcinol/alkylpyrone synthase
MRAPSIVQTATALPEHIIDQAGVKRTLREVLALPEARIRAIEALFDNTLVETRASVLPLPLLRERRSLTDTTALYRKHAVRLGREVASRCLREAAIDPHAIDLIISVSCTGVMLPSLDAYVANELGFRPDVKRLPITELGCAAGAAALGRAHDFLVGHPAGHVLIVAVELPTLSFQPEDVSVPQLVSTALFGDGAAAVLLAGADVDPKARGASVLAARSHLFPSSMDALGFDLREDGFHVVLAKDLPERLQRDFAGVLEGVLWQMGLRRADLTSFLLHPGGRRILSGLAEALSIEPAQMQPSWDVLRDHGNVSSAAIYFVLDRWMRGATPARGSHGLLCAFGPGLTPSRRQ